MVQRWWIGCLLAAAVYGAEARGESPAATQPAVVEDGGRAACANIDGLLRAEKWDDAGKAAEAVIAGKADAPCVEMAHYQLGVAKFMQRDLLGAGRELAKLAPFDQEYGGHARYLLGRVHDLMNERPEAEADYRGVLEWWQKHHAHLSNVPHYVTRAGFYDGVILGEQGKIDEAIAQLKMFAEDAKTAQGAEAVLRIGRLQVKGKKYGEAIETLRPLRDDPRLGDQALWFTARAVIAGAPADDAAKHDAQMRRAAEKLKLAAEKAGSLAATGDAQAGLRQVDELLELGDAQMAMKQYVEAAGVYGQVVAEFGQGGSVGEELAVRIQEGMARRIKALEMAGRYEDCERLTGEFEHRWPKSLLMGSVLFRGAESIYLRGVAGEKSPVLLQDAIQKLSRLVGDYPQFEQVSAARQEWGGALYLLGRYADAAAVLKEIPEAERRGDLATVSIMEGDCLLRTMPVEGDDAVSTGRMLRQAELAAKQFANFVGANPVHSQTPLALFKLGYCYQKMAGSLKDGTWWDTANKARDCYDKVLGTVKADDPLMAAATLERAKVALLLGDSGTAEAQLKKFREGPMAKSELAPVALLKLAGLWRMVGRAQEGVDLLAKIRGQKDERLGAMMEYEYGLCLKDAGKAEDARKVFEGLAANQPGTVEAENSLWKSAQIGREPLASAIEGARRRMTTAKGKGREAAEKQLADATAAMKQWADAWAGKNVEKPVPGAEGAVRLKYEVAWGYRAIAEANSDPEDFAKAEQAYHEAIAMGEKGSGPELEAVNLAWMDLGDMLAARGRMDDAMDAFTGALDTGGEPWVMGKAQVRIAECLLTKGDAWGAIRQAESVGRNSGRMMGQARYVIGEAYLEMKDWKKGMETLRVFEDPGNYLFSPDVADKALLRLGDVLMMRRRREEAAAVYAVILKKYPKSPLVAEAREKMMDAKYAWGGLVFQMQ